MGRIRRPVTAAVLLAALVLVPSAGGCSTGSGTGGAVTDAVGMDHIHDLGINPADGELYAAAHGGLFKVSGGEATRMGSLIQDTMAFAVAGPDRFIGSGHPDVQNDTILDEDMTPLLGLVESTDRGVTWQGRSLQGEVDFHALSFAHDRVYGADASGARFLVSDDMENWETRAEIALVSFSVDPADPDRLVGVADEDVVVSEDGGRTWESVEGAPSLVRVDWDADVGLWSVAGDGSVHTSSDGGRRWRRRTGVEGQPGAILAHPSGLYVATEDAILRSTDQANSWESFLTRP